ncbi:ATPase family AAA domain-containing protein 1 [Cocos nucifera]|uniref:ATPase family AAA domain-containing protein 1 n=1 Tax=Cocos nucifera TaxID=13894 RepID=A0A8K0INA7_COCNU|nr:ATPase family AAA domain-containing protein 1 [Cocos nucifera]
MGASETRFIQELVLYAASAALSCLVLFAGLRQLDPNRAASRKALEQKKEIAKRLGRPMIQTNQYEGFSCSLVGLRIRVGKETYLVPKLKTLVLALHFALLTFRRFFDIGYRNLMDKIDVIACDVINPDQIDVEFESIGGLENIKQALFELVILPLRRPELFAQGKLLSPQKGVLLYGPPGTGKTMLAKAIAKESGAVFINVRISNLMSKWFGDAQKLAQWYFTGICAVAAVFSLAYKLQPAIIFVDEVDSFLGQRRTTDHEALTNMKTEFMSLWDGFTTDQNARVMVLAATNRPSELDEAILRRFTQAFEIGTPDQSERAKILKVILKGERVEDIDHEYIASLCAGFTGSDILEVCKQAAYFPVRDLLEDEKKGKQPNRPRALTQSDMVNALSASRKAKRATSEYRLGLQPPPWSTHGEQDDDQVQNAILEISKLVSHIVNSQSEAQDS